MRKTPWFMGACGVLAAVTSCVSGGLHVWGRPESERPSADEASFASATALRLDLGASQTVQRRLVRSTKSQWLHRRIDASDVLNETSRIEVRAQAARDGAGDGVAAAQGWELSVHNESLTLTPRSGAPATFVTDLLGARFAFRLGRDGVVGDPVNIVLPQSRRADRSLSPIVDRAIRALSWPPWFFLLPGRSASVGQRLDLGLVTYPLGCAVPKPSVRQVYMWIGRSLPCGSRHPRDTLEQGQQGSCVEVRLSLAASRNEILRNFGHLIPDPQDRRETLSETPFGNLECVDEVRAIVLPDTLQLFSYESERRVQAEVILDSQVNSAAAQSEPSDSKMVIVDEVVSESAALQWKVP